ncbi:MAG: transcriptional repressor, partial [bacterium]|nr:transcriptional repressor [bacterium]
MLKIAQNEQNILSIFIEKGQMSSSDIHGELTTQGNSISLVTVKRTLSDMKEAGLLIISGAGRSVKYDISYLGRLLTNVDISKYNSIEPDKRYGLKGYSFSLFDSFNDYIFTEEEKSILNDATDFYKKQIENLSNTLAEKELERFIIELSWKSSKIEGNTYELL